MEPRQYELTFILPPSMAEDEVNNIQDTISGWVTGQQGEVTKASHWGRRRLAYPIQNYKEGYYILLEFDSDPEAIKDLDRRIRLNASIIRHLIVRVEN